MDRKHSTLIEVGVRICVHGFYPLLGIMLWMVDKYTHTRLGTVPSVVPHIVLVYRVKVVPIAREL